MAYYSKHQKHLARLSANTLSIMTFSLMTFAVMTFGVMAFSTLGFFAKFTITFVLKGLFAALSITNIKNDAHHSGVVMFNFSYMYPL